MSVDLKLKIIANQLMADFQHLMSGRLQLIIKNLTHLFLIKARLMLSQAEMKVKT